MYTTDNIFKMTEVLIDYIFVQFGGRIFKTIQFLVDNIFVQFGGRIFCWAIGIPI